MSNDVERILGILEKHNVELPQAALDELNAAGDMGPGSGPAIIDRGGSIEGSEIPGGVSIPQGGFRGILDE